MFTQNMTFIVGAGASWHYGYPTGENLVRAVINKARVLESYLTDLGRYEFIPAFMTPSGGAPGSPVMTNSVPDARLLAQEIAAKLVESDPLVIDYFLGLNPHLGDVGKLLIGWEIFDLDAKWLRYGRNSNRTQPGGGTDRINDNWCRYIVGELISDCPDSASIVKNRVTFVTFNYDLSLETAIYRALSAMKFFDPKDIEEFFKPPRLIHVYGSIKKESLVAPIDSRFDQIAKAPPANPQNPAAALLPWKLVLEAIWRGAQEIRIIDPHQKDEGNHEVAKAALREAKNILILGYGFDKNNNKRIGLDELRAGQESSKRIGLTNYLNSNRINKAVGQMLCGDSGALLDSHSLWSNERYHVEKSTKDVYGALGLDFDW